MSDNVISLAEYRAKKEQEKAKVVPLAPKSSPASKEARQTRINEAMKRWGHFDGTETNKKRKNKERC